MSIRSSSRLIFTLCALLAPAVLLSACDTVPNDGQDDAQQQPFVFQLPQAPVEEIPVISDPQGEIWRPGYWIMQNGQFSWVSGKIIPRPSPTAVWNPARWVQHNYGWSFQEGHWE